MPDEAKITAGLLEAWRNAERASIRARDAAVSARRAAEAAADASEAAMASAEAARLAAERAGISLDAAEKENSRAHAVYADHEEDVRNRAEAWATK